MGNHLEVLENIKMMAIDELNNIQKKNELSPTDWKAVGEAVDIVKDIEEICNKEYVDGYSQGYPYSIMVDEYDPNWRSNKSYNSYGGRYSQARKRNSMGRYSKNDVLDSKIEHLEEMMSNARTEIERDTIEKCIKELERS